MDAFAKFKLLDDADSAAEPPGAALEGEASRNTYFSFRYHENASGREQCNVNFLDRFLKEKYLLPDESALTNLVRARDISRSNIDRFVPPAQHAKLGIVCQPA